MKPPFPCFVNPSPKSTLQHGINCQQSTFLVQNLPAEFPYDTQGLDSAAGVQIHYLVFDGQGPPPDDIGDPGDIYFDFVHSDIVNFGKLVLYARMERCWKLWPGKDLTNLLQHPHLPTYFLWQKKRAFGWTYATKIKGWAKFAAEKAKRERAEAAAKIDWEKFRVEVAPDGLSLSVILSVTETESLRTFLSQKRKGPKRPTEGINNCERKTSGGTASFSKLMDAAINDVDSIYSENQQLKVEVDRLKNIIKTQDNMIQAAQGLAKENSSLHSACQTLLDENSRLKEETKILRETMQNNEEEIARLHEELYGNDFASMFPASAATVGTLLHLLQANQKADKRGQSSSNVSSLVESWLSGGDQHTATLRVRSATLAAPSTGDSEGDPLSSHPMTVTQTASKDKSQELEQESVDFDTTSLRKQSETPINVVRKLDMDLTTDQTEPEQSFNEPNIVTEDEMVTCASSSRFISVGPETNNDGNTSLDTDANTGEVGRVGDNSGLVVQGAAPVGSTIALPSFRPRRADNLPNCNCTEVKMEDIDENRTLLVRSPPQLTVDYLDLIYHTESPVVFCRLCIIRQDKDSSPDINIRVSFPINTPRRKLIDHCENEHPVETRKFALMGPERLAKIRSQISRSGG